MNKTDIKINGDRIFLRKVQLGDVCQKYVNWLNDSEVNQYLETRYQVQTISSVSKYVKKMVNKDDEYFFAICLNENEKHIGNIKLGPVNLVHKFGEISLLIGDKNQWGKGYATEAIYSITNFAFDVLELHKLTAGCYADNIGSIKSFKKVGFFNEGNWKDHYYSNGEYVDRVCLAILQP